MDQDKYDITLVGIDKTANGSVGSSNYLLNAANPKLIKLNSENKTGIIPAEDNLCNNR